MLISMGESLIDLVQVGRDDQGSPLFCAREGGSPFNVAMAMAHLGARVGFVCPTSHDAFGAQLRSRLKKSGVTDLCGGGIDRPTALAVVSTDESGHPSYAFHREKTADRNPNAEELISALPESAEALHFGSMVLAQGEDWPAWRGVVMRARERGMTIAFDPNIRLNLVDDFDALRVRLHEALELSDLVKASDEDLRLLHPQAAPEVVLAEWRERHGIRLAILTQGRHGAIAWTHAGPVDCPGYELPGPVVDTVGAGDTFQGAFLAWLARHGQLRTVLSREALATMLKFATKAAGLNCMRTGCQPPTLRDVTDD
jgi:fructokinase